MRFHTRRLLFTTGGLKGVAYRGNMLFFYFSLPSRASRAGGRIQEESTFYIYAEVQHISSIHYSLWAAFPCSFVMCFLHQGCSRRADCLLHFSFRFSFFSSFSACRRGLRNVRAHMYIRHGSRILIVYRIMIVYRFARDRRKFIEQFYGRNTTALWKRFHLAHETTSLSLSSSS